MNFLSRIFLPPAPETACRDAIDAIFERIRNAKPFAVMPFEATLGARSDGKAGDLASQCDGQREIFVTPAERAIARMHDHGLTAFQMSQAELAAHIAQRAATTKASVFLLSPTGVSDVRLAHHLGCEFEPPLVIAGSIVVEQADALTNAESDTIITRIARSGAALCFAAIDPAMARRLAARARKQRVNCGFIILPAGWRKLGRAAQVGYSGNPAPSPSDSLADGLADDLDRSTNEARRSTRG